MKHSPMFIRPECVSRLLSSGLVQYDHEYFRAVWLDWIFTFSDGQNLCWNNLWQNFLRGNLPLPQQSALKGWPGNSSYMADIFKRHPAWKTVIVSDGKGNFWLHLPEEILFSVGYDIPA